jgi:hypothetical protein
MQQVPQQQQQFNQQQGGQRIPQQQQFNQAQSMQQQQFAQQAQQMPQSYPAALQTPGSIAAPSPQQHAGVASSPMTGPNMVGRSPNPNNRRISTPGPMNMPNNQAAGNNSLKAIFDNFPKLLEAKRAGKLAKEQETLVS